MSNKNTTIISSLMKRVSKFTFKNLNKIRNVPVYIYIFPVHPQTSFILNTDLRRRHCESQDPSSIANGTFLSFGGSHKNTLRKNSDAYFVLVNSFSPLHGKTLNHGYIFGRKMCTNKAGIDRINHADIQLYVSLKTYPC